MTKFSSRKFLIVVLLLLGLAWCVATQTSVDPALLEFTKWIVGLYFTGNVGQKLGQEFLQWWGNRQKTTDKPKGETA